MRPPTLLLVGTTLLLAGCADAGTYAGAHADAWYDDPWDPGRVEAAVAAMGGNASDLRDGPDPPNSYYLGEASIGERYVIFVADTGGRDRWAVRGFYDNGDYAWYEHRSEAQDVFEQDRAGWDEDFRAFVSDFDAATGWSHDGIEWTMDFGAS